MAEWFYASDSKKKGPVSAAELKQLVDDGKVDRADLVWTEGMKDLATNPLPGNRWKRAWACVLGDRASRQLVRWRMSHLGRAALWMTTMMIIDRDAETVIATGIGIPIAPVVRAGPRGNPIRR
jgi:hypothetical protein